MSLLDFVESQAALISSKSFSQEKKAILGMAVRKWHNHFIFHSQNVLLSFKSKNVNLSVFLLFHVAQF